MNTTTTQAPAVTTQAPAQATKPANKGKNKPAQTKPAAARAIRFGVPGHTPTAGASLFAHTAVFLAHSGITEKNAVPSAKVRQIIGDTATKYHTKKGNFADTEKGLILTAQGVSSFGKRAISAELRAGWESVMLDGKPADSVGIKNPAVIKPI